MLWQHGKVSVCVVSVNNYTEQVICTLRCVTFFWGKICLYKVYYSDIEAGKLLVTIYTACGDMLDCQN